MYVRELHVRYRNRWITGAHTLHAEPVNTPKDAAGVLTQLLSREVVEVCGVLCLTNSNRVIAYHELSRGTLDTTLVHPRDVFRTGLLCNAGSVIIGHNHPSGDVSPSAEDIQLTARLRTAAAVIGIEVADHLVIGVNGRYFSFRDAGLIGPTGGLS